MEATVKDGLKTEILTRLSADLEDSLVHISELIVTGKVDTHWASVHLIAPIRAVLSEVRAELKYLTE